MSNPKVELHIKNYGVVTLELDQGKAPKSAANFLSYVNKGHYDNTIFHRVIPGFMVQGGGFEPGMKQKPTDGPIETFPLRGIKDTPPYLHEVRLLSLCSETKKHAASLMRS